MVKSSEVLINLGSRFDISNIVSCKFKIDEQSEENCKSQVKDSTTIQITDIFTKNDQNNINSNISITLDQIKNPKFQDFEGSISVNYEITIDFVEQNSKNKTLESISDSIRILEDIFIIPTANLHDSDLNVYKKSFSDTQQFYHSQNYIQFTQNNSDQAEGGVFLVNKAKNTDFNLSFDYIESNGDFQDDGTLVQIPVKSNNGMGGCDYDNDQYIITFETTATGESDSYYYLMNKANKDLSPVILQGGNRQKQQHSSSCSRLLNGNVIIALTQGDSLSTDLGNDESVDYYIKTIQGGNLIPANGINIERDTLNKVNNVAPVIYSNLLTFPNGNVLIIWIYNLNKGVPSEPFGIYFNVLIPLEPENQEVNQFNKAYEEEKQLVENYGQYRFAQISEGKVIVTYYNSDQKLMGYSVINQNGIIVKTHSTIKKWGSDIQIEEVAAAPDVVSIQEGKYFVILYTMETSLHTLIYDSESYKQISFKNDILAQGQAFQNIRIFKIQENLVGINFQESGLAVLNYEVLQIFQCIGGQRCVENCYQNPLNCQKCIGLEDPLTNAEARIVSQGCVCPVQYFDLFINTDLSSPTNDDCYQCYKYCDKCIDNTPNCVEPKAVPYSHNIGGIISGGLYECISTDYFNTSVFEGGSEQTYLVTGCGNQFKILDLYNGEKLLEKTFKKLKFVLSIHSNRVVALDDDGMHVYNYADTKQIDIEIKTPTKVSAYQQIYDYKEQHQTTLIMIGYDNGLFIIYDADQQSNQSPDFYMHEIGEQELEITAISQINASQKLVLQDIQSNLIIFDSESENILSRFQNQQENAIGKKLLTARGLRYIVQCLQDSFRVIEFVDDYEMIEKFQVAYDKLDGLPQGMHSLDIQSAEHISGRTFSAGFEFQLNGVILNNWFIIDLQALNEDYINSAGNMRILSVKFAENLIYKIVQIKPIFGRNLNILANIDKVIIGGQCHHSCKSCEVLLGQMGECYDCQDSAYYNEPLKNTKGVQISEWNQTEQRIFIKGSKTCECSSSCTHKDILSQECFIDQLFGCFNCCESYLCEYENNSSECLQKSSKCSMSKEFTSIEGQCFSCQTLYGQNCKECDEIKCLKCYGEFILTDCLKTTCDEPGLGFKDGQICRSCSAESNCATCGPLSDSMCTSCIDGYELNGTQCFQLCQATHKDVLDKFCKYCNHPQRECTECLNYEKANRFLWKGNCACDAFYEKQFEDEKNKNGEKMMCFSDKQQKLNDAANYVQYFFMGFGILGVIFIGFPVFSLLQIFEIFQIVRFSNYLNLDYPAIVRHFLDGFSGSNVEFLPDVGNDYEPKIMYDPFYFPMPVPEGFQQKFGLDAYFLRNSCYFMLIFIILAIMNILVQVFLRKIKQQQQQLQQQQTENKFQVFLQKLAKLFKFDIWVYFILFSYNNIMIFSILQIQSISISQESGTISIIIAYIVFIAYNSFLMLFYGKKVVQIYFKMTKYTQLVYFYKLKMAKQNLNDENKPHQFDNIIFQQEKLINTNNTDYQQIQTISDLSNQKYPRNESWSQSKTIDLTSVKKTINLVQIDENQDEELENQQSHKSQQSKKSEQKQKSQKSSNLDQKTDNIDDQQKQSGKKESNLTSQNGLQYDDAAPAKSDSKKDSGKVASQEQQKQNEDKNLEQLSLKNSSNNNEIIKTNQGQKGEDQQQQFNSPLKKSVNNNKRKKKQNNIFNLNETDTIKDDNFEGNKNNNEDKINLNLFDAPKNNNNNLKESGTKDIKQQVYQDSEIKALQNEIYRFQNEFGSFFMFSPFFKSIQAEQLCLQSYIKQKQQEQEEEIKSEQKINSQLDVGDYQNETEKHQKQQNQNIQAQNSYNLLKYKNNWFGRNLVFKLQIFYTGLLFFRKIYFIICLVLLNSRPVVGLSGLVILSVSIILMELFCLLNVKLNSKKQNFSELFMLHPENMNTIESLKNIFTELSLFIFYCCGFRVSHLFYNNLQNRGEVANVMIASIIMLICVQLIYFVYVFLLHQFKNTQFIFWVKNKFKARNPAQITPMSQDQIDEMKKSQSKIQSQDKLSEKNSDSQQQQQQQNQYNNISQQTNFNIDNNINTTQNNQDLLNQTENQHILSTQNYPNKFDESCVDYLENGTKNKVNIIFDNKNDDSNDNAEEEEEEEKEVKEKQNDENLSNKGVKNEDSIEKEKKNQDQLSELNNYLDVENNIITEEKKNNNNNQQQQQNIIKNTVVRDYNQTIIGGGENESEMFQSQNSVYFDHVIDSKGQRQNIKQKFQPQKQQLNQNNRYEEDTDQQIQNINNNNVNIMNHNNNIIKNENENKNKKKNIQELQNSDIFVDNPFQNNTGTVQTTKNIHLEPISTVQKNDLNNPFSNDQNKGKFKFNSNNLRKSTEK